MCIIAMDIFMKTTFTAVNSNINSNVDFITKWIDHEARYITQKLFVTQQVIKVSDPAMLQVAEL